MQAVIDDTDWHTGPAWTDRSRRRSGRATSCGRSARPPDCADPGIQFDTTINRWHTVPDSGRITASNPCSEYLSLDNSACNLASLNLLRFVHDEAAGTDGFDVDAVPVPRSRSPSRRRKILVGNSDYPTDKIGETTRAFRQLGLGYTNLGARLLLMAMGLPYDSDAGRAVTGAIHGAHDRARLPHLGADRVPRTGPFAGYLQYR